MSKFWAWVKLEALAILRALSTDRERYQEGYEAAVEMMQDADFVEIHRLLDDSIVGVYGDRMRNIPIDDFDIGWQDACYAELERRHTEFQVASRHMW